MINIRKESVLRRIYGPIVENGKYRTRTNEKIYLPSSIPKNRTLEHLSEAN